MSAYVGPASLAAALVAGIACGSSRAVDEGSGKVLPDDAVGAHHKAVVEMSPPADETRQQRRARERRDAKAARQAAKRVTWLATLARRRLTQGGIDG